MTALIEWYCIVLCVIHDMRLAEIYLGAPVLPTITHLLLLTSSLIIAEIYQPSNKLYMPRHSNLLLCSNSEIPESIMKIIAVLLFACAWFGMSLGFLARINKPCRLDLPAFEACDTGNQFSVCVG